MRVEKSIRNAVSSVYMQVSIQILQFIVRTVFIRTLSVEYWGINGLFSNILMMLSLAELGIGNAINYSMYKPIAERDEKKICEYMNIYKKLYIGIGIFILMIGAGLIPFLNFFMASKPNIDYLYLIYFLYVINSASTYFFSYKAAIIAVDQKQYMVSNSNVIFSFIQSILQIVFLLITKNFLIYLSINIFINVSKNIYISAIADKNYPFLKNGNSLRLPTEEFRKLYKNVFAMLLHKVSNVILNGTDNLVISKFMGIAILGIYSNYSTLIITIKIIFDLIFNSLTSSVGNLCVKESNNKVHQVFSLIQFVNFWMIGFCSTCFITLFNPFMSIWVGKDYLLSMSVVITIVSVFFFTCMRRTIEMFRDALGLFWYDRYAGIAEAIINIVVSVLLVTKIGIIGVFLGTIISNIATAFWISPYILYKYKFKKSVWEYFKSYVNYFIITLLAMVSTYLVASFIHGNVISSLFIKILICISIYNIAYIVTYYRTSEMNYLISILQTVLKNKYPKIYNKIVSRIER